MTTYHDITFCVNTYCDRTDCYRHRSKLDGVPSGTMISIADFGGECREYICDIVEEIEAAKHKENAWHTLEDGEFVEVNE